MAKNPKIKTINREDPKSVYALITFSTSNNFIFIFPKFSDTLLALDSIKIIKVLNQYYGMEPYYALNPKCLDWCCVVIKVFKKSSIITFYNLSKKIMDTEYNRTYGQLKANLSSLQSSKDLSWLNDSEAISSFDGEIVKGFVTDFELSPLSVGAGFESLHLIVCKSDGGILNYSVRQNVLIRVNNLYVVSNYLSLNFSGKKLKKIGNESKWRISSFFCFWASPQP